MQQSVARGFQAAGEQGGGSGMAFMGMGINSVGGSMGAFQQPVQQPQQPVQQPAQPAQPAQSQEDPYERLAKLKKLADDGVITQEEFEAEKKKLLGV